MSFSKAALGALASLFSNASTLPKPTEAQLDGYPHIIGATDQLIKISSTDEARILNPLQNALDALDTPKSRQLSSLFGEPLCSSSTNNLHIPFDVPNIRVLRKSALADIREYCQSVIQTQAPESIKQPVHCFLNHFPAATLHPEFVRPRETAPAGKRSLSFFPA